MSRGSRRFGSPYDPQFRGTGKTTIDPASQYARDRKEAVRMNEEKKLQIGIAEAFQRAINFEVGSPRGGISGGGWLGLEDFGILDGLPSAYQAARAHVANWLIKSDDQVFDDIVGNGEALGQLRDAITAPVVHKELFEAYGMKTPKGALLFGPPGCGKTMFARAAASEMRRLYGDKVEFLSIAGAELQGMYVGQTEKWIKQIFAFAREYKAHHGHPLLVFIDEADAILPDRTSRVRRVTHYEESQVATFLAEMDGVRESGAFVLLATNRPEAIDAAVLRDGRCDFKIEVKRPNAEAIEAILTKAFAKEQRLVASVSDLIFAATESLMDPSKVIVEARMIKVGQGTLEDVGGRAFLLEHIVSGAMVASIPSRAKRHAFTRDKVTGKIIGITVADVLSAVNDLFVENKGLDHTFAFQSFMRETQEQFQEKGRVLQ